MLLSRYIIILHISCAAPHRTQYLPSPPLTRDCPPRPHKVDTTCFHQCFYTRTPAYNPYPCTGLVSDASRCIQPLCSCLPNHEGYHINHIGYRNTMGRTWRSWCNPNHHYKYHSGSFSTGQREILQRIPDLENSATMEDEPSTK